MAKSAKTPTKNNKKTLLPKTEVKRFNADSSEGLDAAQVNERIAAGMVNKTQKKYSLLSIDLKKIN